MDGFGEEGSKCLEGTLGESRTSLDADKTEAQIPDSRSPVSRFGRETGRGFPVSRFGRERETGNPRFPIRPGTGNGAPIWPKIGKSGILIPFSTKHDPWAKCCL